MHRFSSNWPTWEIHPHGDEVVVLVSGSATFLLDLNGNHQQIELTQAGEYVVVPKGIWHTAHIQEQATLLFITPGEGTENRAGVAG